MIAVRCPGCQKVLRGPDKLAGHKVRCPNCKTVLAIPPIEPAGQSKPADSRSSEHPGPPRTARPAEKPAPKPSPERPRQQPRETPDDEYGIAPSADEIPMSWLSPGAPAAAPGMPVEETPPPLPPSFPGAAMAGTSSVARPGGGPRLTAAGAAGRAGRSPRALAGAPSLPAGGSTVRARWLYLLFSLALLPLIVSLAGGGQDDVEDRLRRSLLSDPAVAERIDRLVEEHEDATLDDVLGLLPEGRVEGAHLAADTWVHWLYAMLSAGAFLGLILLLFPVGRARPGHLAGIMLLTATVGVLSLLMFQWMAAFTQGFILYGGNPLILIPFYIVKFIGFSYSAAMDPTRGFWMSFLGFTCGVGFCEELTKALPVLMHYRAEGKMGWRGACTWGLASGIGFGVAEGIIYAGDFYNGLATGDVYLIRFVSCVALHATWSAAVGVSIYNNRGLFQGDDWDWGDFLLASLKVLGVPMLLHGLYDTLLKRDVTGWALVVAVASFVWLAAMIELARSREPDPTPTRVAVGV